jgi:hypothetical protein
MGRIVLPDEAVEMVRDLAAARVRGNTSDESGHTLQTRLIVMVLLAALHGHDQPSKQWWDLAGRVLVVSDRCRESAKKAIADAAEKADIARGKADARRARAAQLTDGELAGEDVAKAALIIAKVVHAHAVGERKPDHNIGNGCTMRCVKRYAARYQKRINLSDAVKLAAAEKWIVRDGARFVARGQSPE